MPKLVVTLVGVAVLLAAQAALGASARARISVADASPLTVVGYGFPAREAVVVTVSGKGLRLKKTATSTAKGGFSVSWNRTLKFDGCSSTFGISALAADGTRAFLKTVPASSGACAQPVDP